MGDQWKCLTAAAAVLAVAGCGGSSPRVTYNSPTTTATPSDRARAAFIAQADAVCRGSQVRLNVQQHVIDAALATDQIQDTPANRAALAGALRRDEALVTPQVDRLRSLAPAGERVVVERYLAAVDGQVRLIDAFATAVLGGDKAALSAIAQQLTQGKATATGLAQAYGFRVCGTQ